MKQMKKTSLTDVFPSDEELTDVFPVIDELGHRG